MEANRFAGTQDAAVSSSTAVPASRGQIGGAVVSERLLRIE
jgi:hypothetical protein